MKCMKWKCSDLIYPDYEALAGLTPVMVLNWGKNPRLWILRPEFDPAWLPSPRDPGPLPAPPLPIFPHKTSQNATKKRAAQPSADSVHCIHLYSLCTRD